MLRAWTFRASLLLFVALAMRGAGQQPAGKDPGKKEPAKSADTSKPSDPAKSKPGLESIKIPPGGVIVVVEDLKGASLKPTMVFSPEEYRKWQEDKALLEKLLKADKKIAHVCKLTGRIDGDIVHLRAEFTITTEQPKANVALGLSGTHVTDTGMLDGQIAVLEPVEDGYSIRVDKPGTYPLVLNAQAQVNFKRPTGAAGNTSGGERWFEIGLPGAAVTLLKLNLPPGVKELRWNDTTEKPPGAGPWELALGKIKTLNVSWKEPAAAGNLAPPSLDGQVTVKLDENYVQMNGDLWLEDPRGKTTEWTLQLPLGAKAEVKAPASLGHAWTVIDGKGTQILKLNAPTTDRIQVNIQLRAARPWPTPRFAIGPFHAQGVSSQNGTITVQAPKSALRGQLLVLHPLLGAAEQVTEVPKGSGPDAVAHFRWGYPGTGKGPKQPFKAPLELELKADKAQADVVTEYQVMVRPDKRELEVITLFRVKSGPDLLDVQLPRTRIPRSGALAVMPGLPFPATLAWLPLAPPSGQNLPTAAPVSFFTLDDAKLATPDAQRRARLTWTRQLASDTLTITLKGKYVVPMGQDRCRLELPRPVDALERSGASRLDVQIDDKYELSPGTAGADGPILDRKKVSTPWDPARESVEISWKPYRPEFVVVGLADVDLHERLAQVRQQLVFAVPPDVRSSGPAAGTVRLRVPAAIKELKVEGGARLVNHDPAGEAAWIVPEVPARAEVLLKYEFALPRKPDSQKNTQRQFAVPLVWPEGATREEAKVRVWGEAGTRPVVIDPPGAAGAAGVESWRDHGPENGTWDVLPALVLHSAGVNVPLQLGLIEPSQARLASMVCDRGLIQVLIDDEGNHTYRARYLIRKLNARHLDLEFPTLATGCLQSVTLDKEKINDWVMLEPVPNIAQIPVRPRRYTQPVVLEVEYKLPASFVEGKRAWQSTLFAPQFRGDLFLGRLRWQVTMPPNWVAVVPGGGGDYRWGFQGWLFGPEPSVTSAELEAWLLGKDATEPAAALPVSLAFSRTGQDNALLLHASRPMWLLLCSGLVLGVGLVLGLAPLSRTVFRLALVVLGLGLLAVGLVWRGWVPALVMGAQPGLVVLALLLGIQWLLQERYRRQLVFMPGFARAKANSSLLRASANQNRREASTIDAPSPVSTSHPAPTKNPSSSKGS